MTFRQGNSWLSSYNISFSFSAWLIISTYQNIWSIYIYIYIYIYIHCTLDNLNRIRIKIHLPYLRQPVYTSYLLSMFKHLPLCEHRRLVVRDDGFLLKNTIRKKRGFKSTWTSRGHSSRICVYVYKCRFHILQSCY